MTDEPMRTCEACGLDVADDESISCEGRLLCPMCHGRRCAADDVKRMASEGWRDVV